MSTTERGTIRLIGPYARMTLSGPRRGTHLPPHRSPVPPWSCDLLRGREPSPLWPLGLPAAALVRHAFQYAVGLPGRTGLAVAWPVGFLGNRRRRLELGSPGEPGLARAGRLLAWTSALLTLVSLGATAAVLSDFESVTFGMPPALNALLTVPYLTSVLAIGVAVFAVLAWVKGWWTLIGRLHYTLIAAAGLALVWWYAYWNVIL